jgi:hypothetical protein
MQDCRRLENDSFVPDVSHGFETPVRGTQDSLRRRTGLPARKR